MIATALTFVSGFLTAALIALVVAPLFWSRSRRLALREYRAAIPASAREIRASLDHVRAEAALAARRREIKAEAQSEKAALARAEAGRLAGENAELRARNTILVESLGSITADYDEASQQLDLRDAEIEEVDGALRAVQHDLDLRTDELEVLAARFEDLVEIAEERKVTIADLEARIEELSDSQRLSGRDLRENSHAIDRLRGEVSALEAHVAKEKDAVKRLDDKNGRLSAQLAERDDQIARLLGEAASRERLASSRRQIRSSGIGPDAEAEEDARGESRLRLRPAVRPAFGRRNDETETASGTLPEEVVPPSPVPVAPTPSALSVPDVKANATGPEGAFAAADTPDATQAENASGTGLSLAESLGLSARPDFPDALSDEELREKLGDVAARVIALTAEKQGPRSPLDAILDAETVQSTPAAHAGGQPSLADRVRRLREEARDQAAE